MNEINKTNNYGPFLLAILLMVIGGAITYGIMSVLPGTTIVNKQEKEVTVNESGISDAVDKIYDATVIVEVGSNGKINGWGSGVVYDKDDKYGYILTNHHVASAANEITVVYTDETETKAELVGSDELSDIAVLKVPVNTIKKVAEVGKSSDLKVGDTVFAVGTPLSITYKFSVTRGVLSGKDRIVSMSSSNSNSFFGQTNSWYMNLLQIDAPINSGNSGGPLANSNGQIVGITNSKLYNSSALIENMSFSIPVEDAISVATKIRSNGKVTRPYIGVRMATIEEAKMNGINISDDITSGAYIVTVEKNSPAAEAGLEDGDIIVKLGDQEITDYKYLKYYLYRYNVGDTVDVTYNRNGREMTTKIKLDSNK